MSDEITTVTKRAAALLKAGCNPATLGDALKLFDPLEYGSATVESEARSFVRSRPHFQVQPAQEPEEKPEASDQWDLDHASVSELAAIVAKEDAKKKPERSEPEVDSDSEEALAAAAGAFPATYSKGGW